MSADSVFKAVQEACLPGVWSKGVALSRGDCFLPGQLKPEEIQVRVLAKDRPVHPNVTLWPLDGEEEWFCDCGDRNDPCHHVAAVVIALKAGTLLGKSTPSPGDGDVEAPWVQAPAPGITQVIYRFRRLPNHDLGIDRHLLRPNPGGGAIAFPPESLLRESLIAHVGGIRSGRINALPVAASQEDYAADLALGPMARGSLERAGVPALLRALESAAQVYLEDQPIRVSAKPIPIRARLTPENAGYRITRVKDPAVREGFTNGLALLSDAQGLVLRPLREAQFTAEEREMLSASGEGRFFPAREVERLVSEWIPSLERKIELEISARLPVLEAATPRMLIRMEKTGQEGLVLVPFLVYGNPVLARLEGDKMELTFPGRIPLRSPPEERRLIRKLQDELHLQPGQLARFEGWEALEMTRKLQGWETTGGAGQAFQIAGPLAPQLRLENGKLQVSFLAKADGSVPGTADPSRVFEAWNRNQDHVPLLEGGWAKIPAAWLKEHGASVLALLQTRREDGTVPPARLPELAQLCVDSGLALGDSLKKLRAGLDDFEGIPEAPLPGDLRAELRHYQRSGVNWLCFLRDSGLGALLADDMGLGKTLQALCAIRGRTLVVCPTSVLPGWAAQIRQFRPALSVSTLHGSDRQLDPEADIVLTSYGILRQDRELLTSEIWDTVILDEAQTIKNPDSQVARAAHQLQGRFRLALTGTPIENRLDDLWSQFQFLNPGLLGDRAQLSGEAADVRRMRSRIRPFILRRLKREVAPELPPRTEIVLHSELNCEEQTLYQAILAASRRACLEQLEQGGSVLAALESLLRLRQACCHPALVPGAAPPADPPAASGGHSSPRSSKVELLLETLETSLALGHRALVFSQWTSLLDLLEPELNRLDIRHSRLDGSTRDRGAVVEEFQRADGPAVLLISLKAGGVGLTLTAADHIFILDPWWNPAVEDQAADRAHRIGQTNPVLIHRLVARGTVEDRILELQRRKRELAASLLEGAEAATSLTRDDLLALLS